MPRPSEEQWRAARLAADGAPMTRARIAGLLGVDVGAVYLRAAQEGWRTMDFRRPDVREAYQQALAEYERLRTDREGVDHERD